MGGLTFWHLGMGIVPLLGLAALAGAVWFGVRAARKTPQPPASESGLADAEKLRLLKTMTHIAYGLYAAALLFPVTAIAALILDYIKRDEARGTWLESHFASLLSKTAWRIQSRSATRLNDCIKT
jgi:hypothetical protein